MWGVWGTTMDDGADASLMITVAVVVIVVVIIFIIVLILVSTDAFDNLTTADSLE
jgi:hypothetical protein